MQPGPAHVPSAPASQNSDNFDPSSSPLSFQQAAAFLIICIELTESWHLPDQIKSQGVFRADVLTSFYTFIIFIILWSSVQKPFIWLGGFLDKVCICVLGNSVISYLNKENSEFFYFCFWNRVSWSPGRPCTPAVPPFHPQVLWLQVCTTTPACVMLGLNPEPCAC